ncbi:ABC transporter substrate-binding protein [Pseudomonas sp. S25]|uniref:ABC transporter substrate-binding protein n=1 Tax=Pseudomonas maioricensis TaxID=1766623 RepID=A0ABS9ZU47_9PSED|nr:transporter substrate-binding domain-containing protein [Pseudomonas sp. S25]MCI8212393.1 ABC transporter substrate-binding protein [Pseudomonas sp. S25]
MARPTKLLSALAIGLLVLPVQAFAAGKCERLIVTGSPDAPPYLWRDPQDPKHLMGANADLFKQAAQELGIKVEVLYAGKRSQALEEVRSGRMDMLVDAPLNQTELEALDYIHPPLIQNEIMVWTGHDQALPLSTLADLQGHTGAASERIRLTQAFEAAAKAHLTLERLPNLTEAFQKLMLGQVDYVLASRYPGMAMVQTLGLAKDLLARPEPVDRPGLYLALSFNSACNDPWLRGQLAKKMTESAASGLSGEAVKRNLEIWKAQLLQPASASNK